MDNLVRFVICYQKNSEGFANNDAYLTMKAIPPKFAPFLILLITSTVISYF